MARVVTPADERRTAKAALSFNPRIFLFAPTHRARNVLSSTRSWRRNTMKKPKPVEANRLEHIASLFEQYKKLRADGFSDCGRILLRYAFQELWTYRYTGRKKEHHTQYISLAASQLLKERHKHEREQHHCRTFRDLGNEVNALISPITPEAIIPILEKYDVYCFVTKDEHRKVNQITDWTDEPDLFAKYAAVGVELLKNAEHVNARVRL